MSIFESKDLVAESSELIKTHKIEICGEMAYAVLYLMKSLVIKEIKMKIFQL